MSDFVLFIITAVSRRRHCNSSVRSKLYSNVGARDVVIRKNSSLSRYVRSAKYIVTRRNKATTRAVPGGVGIAGANIIRSRLKLHYWFIPTAFDRFNGIIDDPSCRLRKASLHDSRKRRKKEKIEEKERERKRKRGNESGAQVVCLHFFSFLTYVEEARNLY